MDSEVWQKAISSAADPERARTYLGQLVESRARHFLAAASAEQANALAALFSGSQALTEWLLAHPDWVESGLDSDRLHHRRQKQGLVREADEAIQPLIASRSFSLAYQWMRRFKQRELLRIGTRDLAHLANMQEITGELSDLADVCLSSVYSITLAQLQERFGRPYHKSPGDKWEPTDFCVLGMGKLGGQELNYSSDVDVLFLYSEEGHVFKTVPKPKQAGKGLTNHQFFIRLAEAFIAEVGRMTSDGFLYRIDLRLRPEGNAGPLARSLGSYENYYAQWGQTWERMMLIKARPVAGSIALGSEFLEMIQPFRYPRSLGDRTLSEIGNVKRRIEREVVKSGEMERNVKLGRGGIREIEFVVQSLQLLNAGRLPFLQGTQTLPTLQKLVQYNLLPEADAERLSKAYEFLRNVEHRLQMESNQQTHTIPTNRSARERLARLMGQESLDQFETVLKENTEAVRRIYEQVIEVDQNSGSELPRDFEDNTAWSNLLKEHGFQDPAKALHLIQIFVNGPGYVHVSPRTADLAFQLLSKVLTFCPKQSSTKEKRAADESPRAKDLLSDPDRVLARLDSFVSAYGSRSMLYELWVSNPSLFKLILLLFDRSEFLAEMAIRIPDLVDELELSGRLRRRKRAREILEELRHGRNDPDQRMWIRKYHQSEFMRIGLRDILGLADDENNLGELSALADACLEYALEAILRQQGFEESPMAIIGLGKLGGAELDYGSDLDIVFVTNASAEELPALQKVAAGVMDLLSSQTELGVAFLTDARLRPDGDKGLLVNTVAAYEEYYRHRAMLWEIQTLTRARFVAGNLHTGELMTELAGRLIDFKNPSLPLAAYSPDWKKEIVKMRQRIEKERTPPGKDALAIKTGTGGLMDAEFAAQAICLANGKLEPNTWRALEWARSLESLPAKWLDQLTIHYRELRRIEAVLRRWSFAGEVLLPEDPAPFYRVAVRCGYSNPEEFSKAVAETRRKIRQAYEKLMAAI